MSLKLLQEALKSIRTGTDKTAAELGIRRLSEESSMLHNSLRNIRSQINRDNERAEADKRSIELSVADEKAALSVLEEKSKEVTAIRSRFEPTRNRNLMGKVGCWSILLWGPMLFAVFSRLGVAGYLLATVVCIGLFIYFSYISVMPSVADINRELYTAEALEKAASDAAQRARAQAAEVIRETNKRAVEAEEHRARADREIPEIEKQIQEATSRLEKMRLIVES